jgi:predicted nucleic acid-binding protein
MRRVLVDTGPLVAIFSVSDQHHAICIEALRDLPGPLFSCWPVIAETAWLLRKKSGAVQRLLKSIAGGFLEILALQASETVEIWNVMEKYKNISPQLADAALVHLAQRDGFDLVFTLDRRDFLVFQAGHKRAFRIVP